VSSHDTIKILDHRDAAIAACIWAVFQDSYGVEARLLGLDSFPPLERSRTAIQSSGSVFWCYERHGHPEGLVEVEEELNVITICSLAVRPEVCRQGIASALIVHVLQLAHGKRVAVQTAKLNIPAICLYKKFGFTEKQTWTSPEGVVLISLEKCNAH